MRKIERGPERKRYRKKGKGYKRILSVFLTMVLCQTSVLATPGLKLQAAENIYIQKICYSYKDGVLTLFGEVVRSDLNNFQNKEVVKKIVALDGTIFRKDSSYLFYGFDKCESIDLSNVSKYYSENMSGMFSGCQSLKELNLGSFGTSNVTNMTKMFYDCENLTSLDLSLFDTSNVTNMCNMFYNCKELKELDLSSFDLSNVEDSEGMFGNCKSLKELRLGNGIKQITTDFELPNLENGWARGSADGERISGDGNFAEFTNEGTNTYYRRSGQSNQSGQDNQLTAETAFYPNIENWVDAEKIEHPTVGQGMILDIQNSDCTTFSYQWMRGDQVIEGATSNTYTPVEDDIGYKLSCSIKDSSGFYQGEVIATTTYATRGDHKQGEDTKTFHEAKDATCTEAGNTAYYECSCGMFFANEESTEEIEMDSWVIEAKGHDYGEASYIWSDDNTEVTATKVCKNDESHVISDQVTTTYEVIKEPTEKEEGIGKYTATFTGEDFETQFKEVPIDKLPHKHSGDNVIFHAATEATCTQNGNTAYYGCNCGLFFSNEDCTEEIEKDSWVIEAKGHDYGEVMYTWSSDNKKLTATKVCKNDASHIVTEQATVTYEVIKEATEKEEGLGKYTATFSQEEYETQIKEVPIDKLPHKHSGDNVTYHEAVEATCTKAGSSAYSECNCGKYFSDKACTKEIAKGSWVIEAKGHDYGEVVYTWSKDNQKVTATRVCKNDESHKIKKTANTTYEELTKATDTTDGKGRYTAVFQEEGYETQTKDVVIRKLDHIHGGPNIIYHAAKAATCAKAGNKAYYECTCGLFFSDKACTKEITKDSWVIKKKGHRYGPVTYIWSKDNRMVTGMTTCKNDKNHTVSQTVYTTYEVITKATVEKEGLGRYTAAFTKDGLATQTRDVTIPKLEYVEPTKLVPDIFTDVKKGEWYVSAVQFVFDRSIMNGTSNTTFAPVMVLTRGQFVTVLFNMEEKPEVAFDASTFTDIKEKDYFALPVIWAATNDITSGTGEKKFSPNMNITREQLALMLYKYAKTKNYKMDHEAAALDSFPDKGSVSSWATEAMQWAVSNKVLGGKTGKDGNILDPGGQATRAECAQMIKNLSDHVIEE